MPSAAQTRSARRRLDAKLATLDRNALARPRSGWIRTIRESLRMTQGDLGRRLGVKAQSVQDIEASEREGRVRLDTLRRAADAMNCDLVYALVPRESLDATVAAQARRIVAAEVKAAERSMALEAQEADIDATVIEEAVERLVASNRLWRL
jgi:predicted DNA-binding mobile mystery protein A